MPSRSRSILAALSSALNSGGRILAIALLLAVVVQAAMVWDATGRTWFTRYHDPDLAERVLADVESRATLRALGVESDQPKPDPIPNEFTLGMLPGGLSREGISVFSLAGPSLVGAAMLALGWRRRKA